MTFITALEEIEDPIHTSDGEIQPKKYETIEVNEQTANTLLNGGRFAKRAWQCPKCGELYTDKNFDRKPPFCQNPNCNSKTLVALHPTKHHEIGDVLMNNYVFRTMRESEQIYMHNGNGIFEDRGTEAKIKEKTKEMLPNCKSHLQEEVVKHIMSSTGRSKEEFGLPKDKIVVENGILNVKERELEEENLEEQIPLSKLPVEYDPKANCPKIKEFLHDIFIDEDIPMIQEYVGYCLWKSYDYAKALVLLGDGENGKSTFLNLLVKFLGQENVSSTSLYDLLTSVKRRVNLYGKLANIAAETPSAIKNTDAFKKITGKDLIEARKLYKQSFKFYNHAKLIFAANELPELDEHSHAMFRRMILVDCPFKFTSDPNDGHKNADTEILEKITTDEEMSGFLNWALDGLERLLANDKFSETKTQQEVQERWIRETDPERAFISKFVEVDYDYSVVRSDIYDAYSDYCEKHELEACDPGPLTKAVNRIVPAAKKWKPKVNGKQQKSFRNIRLKSPYDEYNHHITDSTGKTTKKLFEEEEAHKYKKLFDTRDNRTIRDISETELNEVRRLLSDDLGRTPEDVADELDMDLDKVEAILKELYDQGHVKKGRAPDGSPLYARGEGGDKR